MKTFYLEIDNKCNNNCIGCCKTKVSDYSLDYFLNKMIQAKKLGYNNILLSGGEFTLFPNFIYLLKKASILFNQISIMTNGRMLSNELFIQKLRKFNIYCIYISLCGHNAKIHQLWTRTPSSYNQTIQGIKNALKYNLNITVVYILWKKNYKYIDKYLNLLSELGVKNIRISNLIPTANARLNFGKIAIELSKIKATLKDIVNYSSNFEKISLEDFPFCFFPYEFQLIKNISLTYLSGMYSLDQDNLLINYPGVLLIDKNIDINDSISLANNIIELKKVSNSYFIKFKVCEKCEYKDKCNGIFKKYVDVFGFKNIERQLKDLYVENISRNI
jgi:MoaA/NifB/PqqE/SkfB family radical SAM enzyme